MFERLRERRFEIDFRSHAEAILQIDFPEVAEQLESVLAMSTIPIEEIIGSGGGETKGTQRLRRSLMAEGWLKHNFVVQRIIDGRPRESQSHEIDHVKSFDAGTIALEIEWNNKDPFFDRDLENFKRLHADGGISIGIIVTRGATLQNALHELVKRFADEQRINSHDDMKRIGLNPTSRQIRDVMKRVQRNQNPIPFREAWSDQFVSDKFGMATTHWSKLQDRVQRGVGNPCPLVLIGLPSSIVTFGEDHAEVQQLIEEGEGFMDSEPAPYRRPPE
ncbi:BglII/BstYI family type II restriction endonuclease [Bradyrhizobium sp. SZCCHNS3002]|uniref:BglII/BstYI family type II restriction endonuclease n=1 Tax=Bradyrhizobium TaxID=374 RepID=UPI0028EF5743|nr:BglII/BstYI family type II restriction endonuclease [Bradyrhizobium sp. SZCCHNS3002]